MVKLLYSIIFVCNNFPEVDSDKTDLYGPFWIYATMAFTLAISQNIYSFLSRPEGMKFIYTVNYVPSAFAIIYSFGVFVPLAFNFLLKVLGCEMTYSRAIQVYGYSQTINVICLMLCAYPNNVFQTFCILYGAVHSSLFIFLALRSITSDKGHNFKWGVILGMAVSQFCLVMTYKFFFFGDLYKGERNAQEEAAKLNAGN